jgi:PAS domain S-box-containing protein
MANGAKGRTGNTTAAQAGAPKACVAIAAATSAAAGLGRLFGALPTDTGGAYVLTLLHDDGLPASRVAEVLAGASPLPVEIAADGMALQPNRIYVALEGDLVTVGGGRLRVARASPGEGRIDSLLVSVAEAYEAAAVVVVLAHLDAEGAEGLAATKRHGGFAIADMRMGLGRMAQEIAAYLAKLARTGDGEAVATSKAELQAVNEELQTVNGQLVHRVADLARANSDLKNLLESTRIATLFLDNDLRLRSFTPASAEVFRLGEADVGRPIGQILSRVTYPELQDDARRVLRTLVQVEREVAAAGEDRQFLARVLPYRSVDNFFAGVVVTFLDITGTARAEAALRVSERRFGEAQQLAGIGVWEWDPERDETWWSPVIYRLWGLPPGEAPPPRPARLVHPDDRADYERAWAEAGKTGQLRAEWRVVLPDRSVRWLAAVGQLERSEGGRRILGITQDVTDRKQTETRLKLLLSELQHRVRNILGVVRSIVARTVRSSDDVDDLAMHLDGRLNTLARTQSVFARTGEASVDLEELVRDEMLSAAANEEQLTIAGPHVRLRGEAAETFALALHELATNAMKYGALASPEGRLAVRWRLVNTSGGQRLSVEWRESGVAALDLAPKRAGFGRELLERGLPYELGASTSLEFSPGGVRAQIELPLGGKVMLGEEDEAEAAQ